MTKITVKDASIAHRLGDISIILRKQDGTPLAHTTIMVRQTNHAFSFGNAAFFIQHLANGNPRPLDRQLADDWLELFNTATLPFYWGSFEPERGKPRTQELLNTAQWLSYRGIALKGHPLTWHTMQPHWLTQLPLYEIESELRHRIRREVSNFNGLINTWDALNESVIAPVFTAEENGITKLTLAKGRIEMIRLSVDEARATNPKTFLLLNDFNLSSAYECLIEGCLEAGIRLDAIGLQTHMHQGYWGEERITSMLNRFARYGLPLHMTENTILSGHLMPPEIVDLNDYQVNEWPSTPEDEARQADEIVRHYRNVVSHPATENITYWDYNDSDAWLGAPAGFIRSDGTRKPSYDALHNLLKNEWWISPTTVTTGANGEIELRAFAGEYEIEVDTGVETNAQETNSTAQNAGDLTNTASLLHFTLSRQERGVRTFTVG